MIVAGVSELHADVISRPALDLLAGSEVKVGYAEEVPHVINRSGTGWCPAGDPLPPICVTPEECVAQIRDFMNAMNNR